jgi:hydrogenase nickel incorporation protein HypA/HybF
MHEMAVTHEILSIALRHAANAKARRVTEIHLVIGQLSSYVDDSVSFYWDIIAKGTPCEGATLRFQRTPARLGCEDCGAEYDLVGELTACPKCSSARVRVIGGTEFRLDAIVVDTDDGATGGRGPAARDTEAPTGEAQK